MDPIAKLYRPLPMPKTKVRQNMSEEEERRLLKVALDPKMPRRLLAGHCLVVMANTSMGFGELRHLRRQDVFLTEDPPFVEVNGGTKNDFRIRSIPLNFLALRSMRFIVKRWEDMGGSEPVHYILPHHARRTAQEKAQPGHAGAGPLFTEPMAHIYRAARGILKDAGLAHLDPYDMRSHAITKLLSNPEVSDQMYTEIVGHVGDAMKRRYSKRRMEKKRGAMDAMCRRQIDLCEQQAESRFELHGSNDCRFPTASIGSNRPGLPGTGRHPNERPTISDLAGGTPSARTRDAEQMMRHCCCSSDAHFIPRCFLRSCNHRYRCPTPTAEEPDNPQFHQPIKKLSDGDTNEHFKRDRSYCFQRRCQTDPRDKNE